ncbi:MAG: hypothetical protein K1060chlam3_00192 [Candidatus Anoxychlamydiales bacterium]|nr:hypothetical protein [Candidatus Anoxychlamydiales bacterium]
MSVKAITTSATDVGSRILNATTSTVKWGAHKVGNIGGFLKDKASVVMSFIMGFFKNIPQYFSSARTHVGAFAQFIRDNKANSAGIAGFAIAVTSLVALAIFKYSKEV